MPDVKDREQAVAVLDLAEIILQSTGCCTAEALDAAQRIIHHLEASNER